MSADDVVSAAVAAGADNKVIVAIVSEFDRQLPNASACTGCKEWQDATMNICNRLLSSLETQVNYIRSSNGHIKGNLGVKLQGHKESVGSATCAFAGANGILSDAILRKTVQNSLERIATLAAAHEALLGCGKCKNYAQLSESISLLDQIIEISNTPK